MSSRKRPLTEISQAHMSTTPSRYAPSTPHAIRALQERSSAKRSARSARSTARARPNGNNLFDPVRPDGSARNILKQFAKITAPWTRRRISTPVHADQDKENTNPDGEDNSLLGKRPNFTFNVEESIEEEDSELPVAPTPSALLNDDTDDLSEQPTITFQNIGVERHVRAMSEKTDRRKSRVSMLRGEDNDADADQDGDATIMTERGRRALSEEATGMLSRYSFGSIRMSEFGSELEIRRESDRQQKLAILEGEDDYFVHAQDDTTEFFDNDRSRRLPQSPTDLLDYSVQFQELGDDSFNLQVPEDQYTDMAISANHERTNPNQLSTDLTGPQNASVEVAVHKPLVGQGFVDQIARKQTRLELAATKSQKSRGKRVKLTRHGTTVPSLPSSLVKRIAVEVQTRQGKKKPKFGKDHIKALEQATEWFFEQVGEDLAAYSSHGRRKKRIDAGDTVLLMKRQRVMHTDGDLYKLAVDWLPQDILDDLDLDEEA